jgi:predicted naringenin-chalcone synthase
MITLRVIGTALPPHAASQERLAAFMQNVALHGPGSDNLRRGAAAAIARVHSRSGILERRSVLSDYTTDPPHFAFFPQNWALDPFPGTAARMAVYRREAPPLALSAARRCLDHAGIDPAAVSHLIVVSCTGFFAPGLDIQLCRGLGLRPDMQRQLIGFMGCYAAFNGLRAARAICGADPGALVLLVCVELCSLHFQRELTLDTIVANCLFSDGAAAALIGGPGAPAGSCAAPPLELLDSASRLCDDSLDHMTWEVHDTGFQMRLSAAVPAALGHEIGPFVDGLLARNGLRRQDISVWPVHPGGRRVLSAVSDCLGLPPGATAASEEVLAAHGNMSSPTVLFVLERALRGARGPGPGSLGLAMAFGPGLTLESLLFRVGAPGSVPRRPGPD